MHQSIYIWYIMEGLIDFLVFAGIIAACIFFDKLNDAVKKGTPAKPSKAKPVILNTPPQPMSTKPVQSVQNHKTVRKATKKNDARSSWKQPEDMSQRSEFKNEGVRSTANVIQTLDVQEPSEYAINTEEDARKAIIWSEILKRKY